MSRTTRLVHVLPRIVVAVVLAGWIAGAGASAPDATLALRWRIESNLYPPAVAQPESRGVLTLRTEGSQSLGSAGWSLWFTSAGSIHPGEVGDHLRIEWINGSLYRLVPAPGFAGIAPGSELAVTLPYAAIVVKDTEAPLGAYLVMDEAPDTGHPIRSYTIEARTSPGQLPRSTPSLPSVVTADAIYARNAGIEDVPMDDLPPVLPTPLEAHRRTGLLHWSHRPQVESGPGLASEATFAGHLFERLPVAVDDSTREPPLRLVIGSVAPHANPEAYTLDIDARQGVTLTANSAAGIFRGLQSLRALLPIESIHGVDLPAWLIHDAPRFGYRGLALDLARNFQPRSVVLRYLDLMARYKLNVLHLHLTDDEGWRLEIAGLPELTTVGARRGHSADELRYLPPAHGSGAEVDDPHGSGYLTRRDFEDILRHAAQLHIDVIPEIEMPGHARAAVKAMQSRAQRLADEGDAAAAQFRLDDPEDHSVYESAQSFTDNVMNPGLESTYAFVDHVLGELLAMYREAGVTLHTVHVGGDELPTGAWTRSPACEALRKRHHLADTADVWNYFYGRVDRLLKSRGLRASGWEEIGSRRARMHGESKLVPNPEFVRAGMTTYVWNNLEGAADLGIRLANAGYRTVLAPVTAFYFDMAYNRNPEEPGGKWAPFIDLEDGYDFVPFDFVRATATDPTPIPGRDGLADFAHANIAGLEGELWSESLREVGRIDYMLMPRLLGLAERAWATDPDWAIAPDQPTAERLHARAWSVFVNQIGKQVLPRLDEDEAGIAYRIPPPGLRVDGGVVRANIQLPGLVMRYTSDGTEPTPASREVAGSIAEHGLIRVAAFARNGRAGRASQVENR